MLCRHDRDLNLCDQCLWEAGENSKRFYQHVSDSLKQERQALEIRMIIKADDGNFGAIGKKFQESLDRNIRRAFGYGPAYVKHKIGDI